MRVGSVNEDCVCGHAKETHFEDQERPGEHAPNADPKKFRGACLGMHCNDCKRYRKKGDPEGFRLDARSCRIDWREGVSVKAYGGGVLPFKSSLSPFERRSYVHTPGDPIYVLETTYVVVSSD